MIENDFYNGVFPMYSDSSMFFSPTLQGGHGKSMPWSARLQAIPSDYLRSIEPSLRVCTTSESRCLPGVDHTARTVNSENHRAMETQQKHGHFPMLSIQGDIMLCD